jgi:hypothetical protein
MLWMFRKWWGIALVMVAVTLAGFGSLLLIGTAVVAAAVEAVMAGMAVGVLLLVRRVRSRRSVN